MLSTLTTFLKKKNEKKTRTLLKKCLSKRDCSVVLKISVRHLEWYLGILEKAEVATLGGLYKSSS